MVSTVETVGWQQVVWQGFFVTSNPDGNPSGNLLSITF